MFLAALTACAICSILIFVRIILEKQHMIGF